LFYNDIYFIYCNTFNICILFYCNVPCAYVSVLIMMSVAWYFCRKIVHAYRVGLFISRKIQLTLVVRISLLYPVPNQLQSHGVSLCIVTQLQALL